MDRYPECQFRVPLIETGNSSQREARLVYHFKAPLSLKAGRKLLRRAFLASLHAVSNMSPKARPGTFSEKPPKTGWGDVYGHRLRATMMN